MKQLLLSIFTASLLASCSSAYKSGQTPDDVYYSPVRETKEEVVEKQETTRENNYLKMKVRNHARWANIDDYSYWNDTRYDYCTFNYNPYIRTNWYPYYFGNTFHNPYITVISYPSIKVGSTSLSNVHAYSNNVFNNSNGVRNVKTGTYSNSTFSGLVKKAFSSSNGSSWDTPSRTFNNSSSSSSNNSSSSSSTSSSAGGHSGGYNSTGSSANSGRAGRN